jgi:hypothetical protein
VRPTYSAPEPLVIWGRMNEALKHIAKQVRHIPEATHDYHGTLKTIHSAALSVVADVEELLTAYYTDKFERESKPDPDERVIDAEFAEVDEMPAKTDPPVPEPAPAAEEPKPSPRAVKRQPQTIRVPLEVRKAERDGQPVSVRERILTMLRRGPQSAEYLTQELVRNGYQVTEIDVNRTLLSMAGASGIAFVTRETGSTWEVKAG